MRKFSFISCGILSVLGCFLAASAALGSDDGAINGDFEDGDQFPHGWGIIRKSGELSVPEILEIASYERWGGVRNGKHLALKGSAEGFSLIQKHPDRTLEAGVEYRLSAYFKTEDIAESPRIAVVPLAWDDWFVYIDVPIDASGSEEDGWMRMEKSFTLEESKKGYLIVLMVNNTSGEISVDDIKIESAKE